MTAIYVLWLRQVKRYFRSRPRIIASLGQPMLFLLAFGFGFIHGFGFANALADLGLGRGDIVVPLLGFNLGVELGQLAVVVAVLPLLFVLRAQRSYATYWLPGASAAIAVVGIYWAVVRWPAI